MPFSTLHYRTDPDYWQKWFPADFITESFPGQFRNWFYSMLAMSTVLRREPPFKTILGYATLFGEDGRPMHKSWGNAIEFNEAAERMGVDVMRWMYARQRPEDNILFGYRTADEARRELLVLWNVFAFFMTYARLAAWQPTAERRCRPPSTGTLDRWILSRTAAGRRSGPSATWPTSTPARRRPGWAGTSMTCRPGTCAAAAADCPETPTSPIGARPSRRFTRRSSARRGCWRRFCPSCLSTCTNAWSSTRPLVRPLRTRSI